MIGPQGKEILIQGKVSIFFDPSLAAREACIETNDGADAAFAALSSRNISQCH